jgi:YD repeat-containing protein
VVADASDDRMSGRVVKTYDADGRILSETHYSPDGVIAFTESNGYDPDGNIISQTMNGDGFVEVHRFQFVYEFDAQGNWTQKTEYGIAPDGRRKVLEIDYRKLSYYAN